MRSAGMCMGAPWPHDKGCLYYGETLSPCERLATRPGPRPAARGTRAWLLTVVIAASSSRPTGLLPRDFEAGSSQPNFLRGVFRRAGLLSPSATACNPGNRALAQKFGNPVTESGSYLGGRKRAYLLQRRLAGEAATSREISQIETSRGRTARGQKDKEEGVSRASNNLGWKRVHVGIRIRGPYPTIFSSKTLPNLPTSAKRPLKRSHKCPQSKSYFWSFPS